MADAEPVRVCGQMLAQGESRRREQRVLFPGHVPGRDQAIGGGGELWAYPTVFDHRRDGRGAPCRIVVREDRVHAVGDVRALLVGARRLPVPDLDGPGAPVVDQRDQRGHIRCRRQACDERDRHQTDCMIRR